MALTGFTVVNVDPGEPLTAQAWNRVVDALAEVYGELSARRRAKVRVTGPQLDTDTTRVVARHAAFPAAEAIRPSGDVAEHEIVGLRAGSWMVQVEAPGFRDAQVELVVPDAGEPEVLEVTLSQNGAFMPKLFGLPLRDALALLAERDIRIETVFDVTGNAFVAEDAAREHGDSPVMFQEPPAGQNVPPEERVGLVVGAAVKAEPTVVVPSLAGMTYKEAEKTLAALGLVPGRQFNKAARAVINNDDRG